MNDIAIDEVLLCATVLKEANNNMAGAIRGWETTGIPWKVSVNIYNLCPFANVKGFTFEIKPLPEPVAYMFLL